MADAPRLVVLLAAVACHGSSHGTPIDAPPDTAVDAPPDAPGAQAPDLRFKWVVGAPSTLEYNTNSENVLDLAFPGGVTLSYGEFTFAPLGMQVNDLGSAPSAA